jgi:transcription termination/antitermination protein NusG
MSYSLKDGIHWWAINTRANFERTVQDQLVGHNVEVFLPTFKTFSRRKDRKKIVSLPLFAGYLFVRVDLTAFDTRVAILRARGVAKIVGGPEGPAPVPEEQIESVMRLCSSDRLLEPWGKIEIGKRVRVVAGGLAGVTGVVVDIKGKNKKIICNVELLGRAVATELRPEDLEAIDRFEVIDEPK